MIDKWINERQFLDARNKCTFQRIHWNHKISSAFHKTVYVSSSTFRTAILNHNESLIGTCNLFFQWKFGNFFSIPFQVHTRAQRQILNQIESPMDNKKISEVFPAHLQTCCIVLPKMIHYIKSYNNFLKWRDDAGKKSYWHPRTGKLSFFY